MKHNRVTLKRTAAFIVAMAMLVRVCHAQPTPKIEGPTTARPGDIVLLDASGSQAEHFDWVVSTDSVTVPKDALTHKILDGGKTLLLASYPGTWRVSLAVSNAEGVKQLPWKVVVGGGPTPGPPPPPPDPDYTDLSDEAREWLKTVPVAHRGPAKDLRETLEEIGGNWKQAGSIQAMETLITVGVAASLRPLGANAASWSKFFAAANTDLEKIKAAGATAEQYGKSLQSIAKGLE